MIELNKHYFSIQWCCFYCILLLHLLVTSCGSNTSNVGKRITIINNSGRRIEIYWVHPDKENERVLMTNPYLLNEDEVPFDSWVGHRFEAREVPDEKSGQCDISGNGFEVCRNATINVTSEPSEATMVINSNFEVVYVEKRSLNEEEEVADEGSNKIIESCEIRYQNSITKARSSSNNEDLDKILNDFLECIHEEVAMTLDRMDEKIAFQNEVLQRSAWLLENFTCLDETLDSTNDIREEIWFDPKDSHNNNNPYTVHIKHDRKASKIHVIDGFIREDECILVEELAKPELDAAVVDDGKGGVEYVSDHRKALQGSVEVPWDEEENDNPVARVSRRVLDYVNHVLGLNITEHGQEELMSIQYYGRGRNDTEPDRYTPHCDGACSGLPHSRGHRMATMVMYCEIPDSGGHTNFGNANVHVKPQRFAGLFFSYIDPIRMTMDSGFTEHSGCPVFDGEKKIVTQWIRFGVDHDNPWNIFDKDSSEEEEEEDEYTDVVDDVFDDSVEYYDELTEEVVVVEYG